MCSCIYFIWGNDINLTVVTLQNGDCITWFEREIFWFKRTIFQHTNAIILELGEWRCDWIFSIAPFISIQSYWRNIFFFNYLTKTIWNIDAHNEKFYRETQVFNSILQKLNMSFISFIAYIYIYTCVHTHKHLPNLSACAGWDTRSTFKWSLTGLNLFFLLLNWFLYQC